MKDDVQRFPENVGLFLFDCYINVKISHACVLLLSGDEEDLI